jgi:serine/threonine protein kinase
LKPSNVLLGDACETRIADFGLSKFVEVEGNFLQLTEGRTAKDIMSPEIDENKVRLADRPRPIP